MSSLISCIMPTRNRAQYIRAAIECWERQEWPWRELIVVDNSEEPVRDIVPNWANYVHIGAEKKTVGEMRNICCSMASGDYIACWDDDDYSHPRRLTEQMKLITQRQCSVVGYGSMYFIDEAAGKAWLYRNDEEVYALGTSMLFTRSYWKGNRFPEIAFGEDTAFIERAQRNRSIASVSAGDRMVARNHSGNTCPRSGLVPPMWMPADYVAVAGMMGLTAKAA